MSKCFLIMVLLVLFAGCKSEGDSSSSSEDTSDTSSSPSVNSNTSSSSGTPESSGSVSSWYGSISGSLVAKTGAPASSIANAAISVESNSDLTATSDADGNFTLENATPGTYTLYINSALASRIVGGVHVNSTGSAYGLKITDVTVTSGEETDLGSKTLKETGSISGTINFFTNPNSIDLTGSDVYIPGTSFTAKTDSSGNFTLSGVPEGTYSVRAEHTGFASTTYEDIAVSEGQTTAIGTKYLSLSTGPEGSIAITATHTPTISGTATKVSNSLTVDLVLTYDNDAVLMQISDESSFIGKEWESVSTSSQWTFTSDGSKTLYVKYSDLNGLESSPDSDSIVIDTEVPTISTLSVLNGWSHTASTSVFVDSSASDSGTGVYRIWLSNDNSTGTWYDYASRTNWTLAAGANGERTVYAKVKDYIDRESSVITDSINLGTHTKIDASQTYSSKITLYNDQSPYWFYAETTFDGDLEVEAGSTVEISDSAVLYVNGVFTARGTPSNRILFKTYSFSDCSSLGALSIYDTLAGVSEDSFIENTTFKNIGYAILNGGTIQNNNFDNVDCSSPKGYLQKNKFDNLYVKNNNFTNYDMAIYILSGENNTVFDNNYGTVAKAIDQGDTATGTVYTNNNLSADLNISSPYDTYFISVNEPMSFASNIFSSIWTNVFYVNSSDSNVNISGLHVDGCENIIKVGTSGENVPVSISNSQFYNCNVAVYVDTGMSGSLDLGETTFEYSNINVSKNIIFYINGATSYVNSSKHRFSFNNITCHNESAYCSFFDCQSFGGSTFDNYNFIYTQNNIICNGNENVGCRGIVIDSNTQALTGEVYLTIDNNNWTGKYPEGDIAANPVTIKVSTENGNSNATYFKVYELWGDFATEFNNVTWTGTSSYTNSATPISGAGPQ